MKKCLICREYRKFSTLQCKLCGMGIESKMYKHDDFVFCSEICMDTFKAAMKKSTEFERMEMIRKDVVI